jgi:hypothetical protein
MRTALGCCLLALALAAPRPAQAGGPTASDKEQAISRFKRGLDLYREGDLRAALSEFRRAYTLAPTYRVQFNIGQVCVELRDHACALTAFEAYLKQGGEEIPPARRAAIAADVARLSSRVARLAIDVPTRGAVITVDDEAVGTAPLRSPVLVSAGRRKVTAQVPGAPPITRVVDVAGAETVRVALVPSGSAHATEPPRTRWTPLSFAGIGVAGALTAGAVVSGVLAQRAADRGSDVAPALAITTGVLGGAAASALAATLVATYAKKLGTQERASLREAPRVWIGVAPTAIVLEGRF